MISLSFLASSLLPRSLCSPCRLVAVFMKRKTVKKLSKRISNLTAKIIASERWIEGVRGEWRGIPQNSSYGLICPTAYNVSEHNIFNPLFLSNIKHIQANSGNSIYDRRCRVPAAFVLFSPRARKDYPEWLNFLIPSAAACTRNWIGSIDRGLSILNYGYVVETGSRARRPQALRGSSFAAHDCVAGGTREPALLRIIVSECRLVSKETPVTKKPF